MNGAGVLWGFPLLALPGSALRGPAVGVGVAAALLGVQSSAARRVGRFGFVVPFGSGWGAGVLAVTVNAPRLDSPDVTVYTLGAQGLQESGSVTAGCAARWYRVGAGETCGGLPLGTAAYLRGIVARHGLRGAL